MPRWLIWVLLVSALAGAWWFVPSLLGFLWIVFFIFCLTSPVVGFPIMQKLQDLTGRSRIKKRDIRDLKSQVANIGNPYQKYKLGLSYVQIGKYRNAAEILLESLRAEDDNLDAHYQLGKSLFALKRYPEAMAALENALSLKADHDWGGLFLLAGRCAAAMNQPEKAIEYYQGLERISPHHPEGIYRWAWALRRLGKRDQAKQKFRQVREAVRTSPPFFRRRYTHLAGRAFWLQNV